MSQSVLNTKSVLDRDNALELCQEYLASQDDIEVLCMFLRQWFPAYQFETNDNGEIEVSE